MKNYIVTLTEDERDVLVYLRPMANTNLKKFSAH